mgnify:CR=1 FL=1
MNEETSKISEIGLEKIADLIETIKPDVDSATLNGFTNCVLDNVDQRSDVKGTCS